MGEANVQNAISVYMAASSYHHNVPVDTVDTPDSSTVEETKPAVYRILPREARNKQGRFKGPLAICSYNEDARQWTVQLRPENATLLVNPRGDSYQVLGSVLS